MNKRKKFGQHFLKSKTIAKSIVSNAKITRNDVVLEVGTGHGILIPYMCKNAKKVYSIESDRRLHISAKSNFDYSNLVLEHGDGFNSRHDFSIFISNLPYSKSRFAIEWLLQKKFSRAVIMVQAEFAEKLISKEEHKAISVLANHGFRIIQNFGSASMRIDNVEITCTTCSTSSISDIVDSNFTIFMMVPLHVL